MLVLLDLIKLGEMNYVHAGAAGSTRNAVGRTEYGRPKAEG
jgi:hypothetical protein